MYVCLCHAITDRDISAAAEDGVRDVSELGAVLGVATGCGSCADMAQGLLDAAHGKASAAPPQPGTVYRYNPASA